MEAGGWKAEIRVPAWLGSGEGLLSYKVLTSCFNPHLAERAAGSLAASYKITNPIHENSTFKTWLSLQNSTFKHHHIGDWGFNTWILRGIQTFSLLPPDLMDLQRCSKMFCTSHPKAHNVWSSSMAATFEDHCLALLESPLMIVA